MRVLAAAGSFYPFEHAITTQEGEREWITSRAYEISDMSGIGRELAFVDRAAVPGEDNQLDGAAESMNTAGEAAGAAGETPCADRGCSATPGTAYKHRRNSNDQPADCDPAHNTAAGAIYLRGNVDVVFLLSTKVNNSSSSFTSRGSSGTSGCSGRRAVSAFSQLITLRWVTPSVRPMPESPSRRRTTGAPDGAYPRCIRVASAPGCICAGTPSTGSTGCPKHYAPLRPGAPCAGSRDIGSCLCSTHVSIFIHSLIQSYPPVP
jgi:hypothetical protein